MWTIEIQKRSSKHVTIAISFVHWFGGVDLLLQDSWTAPLSVSSPVYPLGVRLSDYVITGPIRLPAMLVCWYHHGQEAGTRSFASSDSSLASTDPMEPSFYIEYHAPDLVNDYTQL